MPRLRMPDRVGRKDVDTHGTERSPAHAGAEGRGEGSDMITVANVRTTTAGVYIGRRMPGRAGSPLGNPYTLTPRTARAAVIAEYEAWLDGQLSSDTRVRRAFDQLVEAARHGDLVLLCWCAPLECHGDVIRRRIEDVLSFEQN